MNARRFNNNTRRRNNNWRNNNFRRNTNNNKRNFKNDSQLVMRNIPRRVINDIIRTNLPNMYKRGRNYRNQINSKMNNINKKLKVLDNKIVSNKIPNTDLKSISNKKTKKEVRTDKIKSPMSMVLSGHFIPIYRISERCLINYTYTKIRFTVSGSATKGVVVLFPYSINFNPELYDQIDDKVYVQDNLVCNLYHNVFYAQYGTTTNSYDAFHTTPTGVIGNWKLIGTSYKIYNVTSRMYLAGNVTITKMIDNIIVPYFLPSTVDVHQHLAQYIEDYTSRNYDLVQPKMSFSPTQVIRIDEYNTSDGTNIFQSPTEYIGCKFTSDPESFAPNFSNDLVGNNAKYIMEIVPGTSSQTYVIEIWNVFAVIPSPRSGMGNIVHNYDYAFNKSVVEEMKTKNPIYSNTSI